LKQDIFLRQLNWIVRKYKTGEDFVLFLQFIATSISHIICI
jgi:hypothetical protein